MASDSPRRLSREGAQLAEAAFEEHEHAPQATVYLLAEIVTSLDQIHDVLVDIYLQGRPTDSDNLSRPGG